MRQQEIQQEGAECEGAAGGAGLKFGWGGLGQMRPLLVDLESRWEGGVRWGWGARAVHPRSYCPSSLLSLRGPSLLEMGDLSLGVGWVRSRGG